VASSRRGAQGGERSVVDRDAHKLRMSSLGPAEGDAGRHVGEEVGAGGGDGEGDAAGGAETGVQRRERAGAPHCGTVERRPALGGAGAHGRGRGEAEIREEGLEVPAAELLSERVLVAGAGGQIVQRHVDRRLEIDGDEPTREPHAVGVVGDALAGLPADRGGVGEHALEVPELLDELGGLLLAHARDARDVVGRVPHQGEEVDDAVGADAPLLADLVGAVVHALHQVEQVDPPVDDLAEVLVAAHDPDVHVV
jgi:hypothetical protein